jgi:hypothetical protein
MVGIWEWNEWVQGTNGEDQDLGATCFDEYWLQSTKGGIWNCFVLMDKWNGVKGDFLVLF